MKELKVGEKVTITLEVVEQDSCDGCFFFQEGTCYNPTINDWADSFKCEPYERLDGKEVIFKEVKK